MGTYLVGSRVGKVTKTVGAEKGETRRQGGWAADSQMASGPVEHHTDCHPVLPQSSEYYSMTLKIA